MGQYAIRMTNDVYGIVCWDIVSATSMDDAVDAGPEDVGYSFLDQEQPLLVDMGNELITDLQPTVTGAIDTNAVDPFGRG